ncbi:MAG: twin-arginine translocation signal domain-containing protein, partial [Planctomycetaceae bacterium]
MNHQSRRSFLQSVTLSAAALAVGAPIATSRAAGPVQRNGKPHMKLSLAAYSYRDYLQGKLTPKMSLD